MGDWKDIIKNSVRYKNFTLIEKPMEFKMLFNGKNIPYIQLHSTHVYGSETQLEILGFCGVFKWEDNIIKSLDGDSYDENMLVVGYDWFTDKDGNKCVDILVSDW